MAEVTVPLRVMARLCVRRCKRFFGRFSEGFAKGIAKDIAKFVFDKHPRKLFEYPYFSKMDVRKMCFYACFHDSIHIVEGHTAQLWPHPRGLSTPRALKVKIAKNRKSVWVTK